MSSKREVRHLAAGRVTRDKDGNVTVKMTVATALGTAQDVIIENIKED